MSDNIRDRIAAAIRRAAADQTYWVPGPVLSAAYADAVIQELGLQQQFHSGTTIYNRRLNSVHVKSTRWVTNWTADTGCSCSNCCGG